MRDDYLGNTYLDTLSFIKINEDWLIYNKLFQIEFQVSQLGESMISLIYHRYLEKEWEEKGWIHEDDPRGWFEWYCKFFLGRRHEDDQRQIKRWNAFCGINGRWRNAIYKKIFIERCMISQSLHVSPRIQQSLLHWSYIVNEKDFEIWKSKKEISSKEH